MIGLLVLCTMGAFAHDTSKVLQQHEKAITEYSLPPEQLAKAHTLYRTENVVFFFSAFYSFAVMVLLLRQRLAARLRDWAERWSSRKSITGITVGPLFIVTLLVLLLPPAIYGHHIGRKYGLSVQSWASWFRDWTVQLVLLTVVGTIVFWILYAIIRRSPRRCWFYFWLAGIPIAAFLTFIAPDVIDPLFNRFEPLDRSHAELVSELEKVAHRGRLEIPRSRMYLMIASAKVTGSNAYVTGFSSSKRVVVWDTAISHSSIPELMFTFGHELGHYVLGHVMKGFLFGAGIYFFLFYIGYRTVNWALRRWGERWGIRGMDDWASLPLLVLVMSVLSFLAVPALNAYSRHIEHQADVYGLQVTQGLVPDASQVAARSFQKMGEEWLDYPYVGKCAKFWRWDHPTTAERVRFALEYKP